MSTPKIVNDEMYQLLREEKIAEFNQRRAKGEAVHFAGLDFRGLDLRGIQADNIVFSNGYFRQTDLRGVDLSTCRMDGASICNAKISGTYFPAQLSAQEIMLSLSHGTRMRARANKSVG